MLNSADVMRLFRFSKSTLWRLIGNNDFPKPIYVGRSPLWHEATLKDFLSAQQGLGNAKPSKKRDLDELC